ncbi:uncharacterized protein LOC143558254 [Bidens hawaiensis]|uniref:uncharacterized protein LOC143558254 n=1 Tax=Bidens hawaiensis TaxID=980011 RepID=UPI00404B85E6
MDWTENQQCVLCDKGGGNLLVCNDDGCPISVHQNCMGCEPQFDVAGNFHCPYCVYKQCTAEASRLKSKVMLTKKALSTFLESSTRDDNDHELVVETANKENNILSKDKSVDENDGVGLENRDEVHDALVPENTNEVNSVSTCKMMVVYEPNLDHASKKMKVDQQTNGECKSKDVDQAEKSKGAADVWLITDKQTTQNKRNTLAILNNDGRKEDPVVEHGAKKESKQLSLINRNKRGRVLWSEQEEEMLKEGVQKYSALTKKNLPWRKILEFGHHVFDSSRTPSDLKDKWRKIAK